LGILPFGLQGPEVRSGDLPQPIMLKKGNEFTFTIKRGVGTDTSVSVNYDDFVNDVEEGDTLLIDGISLFWLPFHDVELYLPFFSPLEFQCFC
jgi:pyruvate kinase